jgi:oxygen-independent coproporphyrinogen III oxidase
VTTPAASAPQVAASAAPARATPPLSLYLHIPFCQVRCAYCDFNTYAGLEDLMPAYAAALVKEIRAVGAAAGTRQPVHTVFFGGGTPSLLPLADYEAIFAALRDSFDLAPGCEITLEANPGTVNAAYLSGLRELGVNRLSFGVQSTHAAELTLLDRLHTFDDVVAAVGWARAAGFNASAYGLNLDLIFALPHQTLASWQASLQRVLALRPEHLSLYALSLENGTPMRAWVYRGLLPMPDPDLAADMYNYASDTLADAGYAQYEISNWALSGHPGDHDYFQCRHNLQYWRNWPYLGLGAGAHGCANGWRYSNTLAPAAYIKRISDGEPQSYPFSAATLERNPQPRTDAMNETMLLGLRLTQAGVAEADFRARYGVGLDETYGRTLRRLVKLGLLAWDEHGARLTHGGRLLGNRVFQEFV